MYHIALCEDEEEQRDKIGDLLEKYGDQRENILFSVERFENAEELLEAVKNKYEPDLLLIDIYMPGILGIEAAKELRKMGLECGIIFLTVSREHALDAFRVDAAQYLLKPVSEQDLFSVLDRQFRYWEEMQKKYMLVEQNGRVCRVTLKDIVYCEAQRKSQCIYMSNGASLMLHMTMAWIHERLAGYREFVRVGIAYIVNLEHIDSMNAQELRMDNGERIYLPRGAHKKLREQYFDYYCLESEN